ncbi:SUKH-3 immunity protein [Penicillium daleae]|uniref:SUKH-3 immunity protein n=1 Tax=Penicillium daleae TaxID=63821 RepID=A0AAD6BYM0_9EURO|nr:SUKH-3 immunity protein [Penicillium daleae]KAJ5438810.1 SUKH-3 immunity protein [Penicillium daleae]
MDNYTAETERVLRDAGWIPGRGVDIGDLRTQMEEFGFIMSEAAERFLSEFFGLVFKYNGPGITRAREMFEFDPLLAEGEDDRFTEWSEEIGECLTPIGMLDRRWNLGISNINMRYQNLDALNGRQPAAYAFLPALKTPSPYNPPEATHKMNKLCALLSTHPNMSPNKEKDHLI